MRAGNIMVGFLFALLACKKSGTSEGGCTPESREYTYQSNKQINLQRVTVNDTIYEHYNYTIASGDKDVFNYTLHFRDCPEFADDEGALAVIFEIPGTANSFELKDSANLVKAKALVSYFCFCYPIGPVLVKEGFIQGTKQGNVWHVKGSVKISSNNSIDFESDFIRK